MTTHSICGVDFSNISIQESKRVLIEPKPDTLTLFLQQQRRQTVCALKTHFVNTAN